MGHAFGPRGSFALLTILVGAGMWGQANAATPMIDVQFGVNDTGFVHPTLQRSRARSAAQ